MLTITVEGATPDEIARGIAAAEAVFREAGIHPLDGANAVFDVEGWDIKGLRGRLSNEVWEHFDVWCRAERAALEACCGNWAKERWPETPWLEYIEPERSRGFGS
ncbi:hypothetical protein L598_000700000520 [Mesorhizobium sp. J18]|uniref:hypothetical protein n=1 Tax=Mesorhizobium sp. J18 TaxID=935263 RepID=UPI001199C759|nr:hypothetical protein [Mesorhizobium sp. J18]TWG90296.1 hypothetical protein L598_000700000520 [Mesorhizobium sp. J18]